MSMPKIECAHVDQCCAVASVLQSIALQEAALSHILNAEGEKLQKAVAMAGCTKELLEVNKSVEEMVEKVTALEEVLKEKLELIIPILERCEKKHKEPCKDECKEHCKEHCKESYKEPCREEY